MDIVDFRDRPLLFIDLEMTGLNPVTHEITELGAVLVDGRTFEIKHEYEAKIIPEHIETADPAALAINGYTAEEWKDAKPLLEVLTAFNSFATKAYIAGWNVSTDKMFLEIAFNRLNMKPSFDYHTLDVIGLAWLYAQKTPEMKEMRLSVLADHFGISRVQKHRAFDDTKVTFEVFKRLVAEFNK